MLFVLGPLVAVLLVWLTRPEYMSFPDTRLTLRWYRKLAERPDLLQAARQSLWLAAAASSVLALGVGLVVYAGPLGRHAAHRADDAAVRAQGAERADHPVGVRGVGLSDRPTRLLVAHNALTLPYAVRTISAASAALDPSEALAALNLGAGPCTGCVHVMLPQLRPELFAAGPGSSTLPMT